MATYVKKIICISVMMLIMTAANAAKESCPYGQICSLAPGESQVFSYAPTNDLNIAGRCAALYQGNGNLTMNYTGLLLGVPPAINKAAQWTFTGNVGSAQPQQVPCCLYQGDCKRSPLGTSGQPYCSTSLVAAGGALGTPQAMIANNGGAQVVLICTSLS